MDKNNIFISHASEDKKNLVEPFLKCLDQNGITNYWYDKEEIETGDIIVKRINEGLSTSKIGVIIFSKNYPEKYWPIWELTVILTLLITHKIRIIPFMSDDITYDKIVEQYPILAPIRFDPIPCCDEIVSIVRRKLSEACNIIDNPISSFTFKNDDRIISHEESVETATTENVKEADEDKLSQIYEELKDYKIAEVREMAMIEIRNYSQKENLWNFKLLWKIIELLISSDSDKDRLDGIYILTEVLRKSIQKLGENNYVIESANELYAHKLLESIKPDSLNRITSDSLNVLEIILDYDNLFNICLWGLIDGVKSIKEDNEYSNYIQKLVYRLEKGSREQTLNLCEQMRLLAKTNQDSFVRKRALELFNHFHRKGL